VSSHILLVCQQKFVDKWDLCYSFFMRLVRNPSYKHPPEFIREFNKHKDSISYKDHTQYTGHLLNLILDTVVDCKKLGLSNKHILWLTKQIYSNQLTEDRVKEDFLPLIKFHFNNQELLKSISEYKSISELNTDIESLGEEEGTVSEKELDIFFEKDGWILAMPHTTKASCLLGKGTTWCTARTKSQNLFLNYVGKFKNNIVLFYVIKINGNPAKNPDDKLSIGFQDSEPFFEDEDGNITVNADNKGINLKRFGEILGSDLAKTMLIKMDEKSQSIKGKHPAKKEMERIAKSVDKYLKKTSEFKNKNELDSFKKELFKFNLSEDMQKYIIENEDIRYVKSLAKNPSITESLQLSFSNDMIWVRENLAKNTNLIESIQLKLVKDNMDIEERICIMTNLASNKHITEKTQLMLTRSKDWRTKETLAENRSLSKLVQKKLSSLEEMGVLEELSRNPIIDEEIQMILYKKGKTKLELAQNENLAEIIQLKLAKDKVEEVKITLAKNKNITEATQLLLIENDYDETFATVKHELAAHPSLYESAQIRLAKDEHWAVRLTLTGNKLFESTQIILANDQSDSIRKNLAENLSLTEEMQLKLAEDKIKKVREVLAKNRNLFISTQIKLSKDKDVYVRMSLGLNERLDEKAQQQISGDRNSNVRAMLAHNHNTVNSIKEKLANDSNYKVRAALAGNIAIPEYIQIILASDKNLTVRKALSKNRSLTERAKNILEKEQIDNLAKEIEKWY
jgi:hypothetical protein